ncbi:unnamed protein product, partial [marine sediment metagenome]
MKSKAIESKTKEITDILKYITKRKELLKFFEETYPGPFEKLINHWLIDIEPFENKEELLENLIQYLEKKIRAFEKSPILDQLTMFEKKDKIQSEREITKIEKELSKLTLSLFSNVGFSHGDYRGQTDKRGEIEYIFTNKKGQSALLPESKTSSLIKKYKEGR